MLWFIKHGKKVYSKCSPHFSHFLYLWEQYDALTCIFACTVTFSKKCDFGAWPAPLIISIDWHLCLNYQFNECNWYISFGFIDIFKISWCVDFISSYYIEVSTLICFEKTYHLLFLCTFAVLFYCTLSEMTRIKMINHYKSPPQYTNLSPPIPTHVCLSHPWQLLWPATLPIARMLNDTKINVSCLTTLVPAELGRHSNNIILTFLFRCNTGNISLSNDDFVLF